MEKLRAYLTGKKKAEFASRIGTTPSYLSQILSGKKTPSIKMMARIRDESAGAVRLDDWTPYRGDMTGNEGSA
jgi:transcriptional regulator with XRE-family HTH domain